MLKQEETDSIIAARMQSSASLGGEYVSMKQLICLPEPPPGSIYGRTSTFNALWPVNQ